MCCRNITLLHYIITVLEKKYPKVATFSEELQNVPDAAKINMTELEKDVNSLRSGLKSVEAVSENTLNRTMFTVGGPRLTTMPPVLQELKFQQTQSSHVPKDKFVSVVSQFITVASFSFSEVEESFLEAKEVVRRS